MEPPDAGSACATSKSDWLIQVNLQVSTCIYQSDLVVVLKRLSIWEPLFIVTEKSLFNFSKPEFYSKEPQKRFIRF